MADSWYRKPSPILISLQRWQHTVCKETKHFVSPHLIGLQLQQLEKRCVDWSILRDLLGADICGELPELSETNAERNTGLPLLSAAESRSLALQPLSAGNSAEFSQAILNSRNIQRRAMNLTSLDSLGFLGIDLCILQTQQSGRNINKITLKSTGTQSSIFFGHSRASIKWPEKRKYGDFKVSFQIISLYISTLQ